MESKRLLDPIERSGSILFGLIMALTFTCSIRVAYSAHSEIRDLLIAAVGCNLAWGIVDATMYLVGVLANRSKNKMILDEVRTSHASEETRKHISDALPPIVASVLKAEELENIRNKIINFRGETGNVSLNLDDLKKAFAIFLLTSISTFPVTVPFLFIDDTSLALRTSNLIALVMMFLCGWSVAHYVGFNRWVMGVTMIIIGFILVAITIALGG